ncbi:hypothetical protein EC968_007561 [Mortierella alpina]|nr:hypothetical protein EC968_007561 [Mortierella alpina]
MTTIRRVAIVTGASRGIGRGIALRLAKDGFNVIVNYQSSAAKAQEVVDEIAALNPIQTDKSHAQVRAIAVQADAGKVADCRRLLDETIAAFGRIDILILNAAFFGGHSIRDVTEESFADAINTNVKGPLFLCKLAQPYLQKAQLEAHVVKNGGSPLGGSRIINISSIVTTMSDVRESSLVYTITKGALDQITRRLARDQDFGGKGITVNGVAPGPVDTDILKNAPQSWIQSLMERTPQKRLGEVDDVADVVSFLASNESRWVNGQTIAVAGGLVMTNSRRVAIVTGAARGIGRGIALRLAKDGFNVVVNYQSNAAKAQEIVDEITALHSTQANKNQEHVRAIAVQADAAKTADGKRLLDETMTAFGRLDIVVFNAAWARTASIREATEELFEDAVDTNVKGPLFFSKLAQPYLEKAQTETQAVKDGGSPLGGSRIISISSMVTTVSDPNVELFVYTLTKGALDQLTRVLARDEDFGGKGITVNGVAPGPIDTDTLRTLPESELQAMAVLTPLKRLGEVDDVADVVSFLSSNDSRWVNGQTITVAGGLVV